MKKLVYTLLLFSVHLILAQLDTTYSPVKFIQVRMQNDLFQIFFRSDKNLTNGLEAVFFHPKLNNKVVKELLLGYNKSQFNDYGISLNQDIYTPENISISTIDSTDRPYCGLLYATYKRSSCDYFKGSRINTQFHLGVCGPIAFAGETQNGIHRLTESKPAIGWDNQIGNGLMIDYSITYNQLLPISFPLFESSFYSAFRAGTIRNGLISGLNWKLGYFGDSYYNTNGFYQKKNRELVTTNNFKNLSKSKLKLIPKRLRKKDVPSQINYINNRLKRKLQFYANLAVDISYYLYDGTISGSLISFHSSPYTIPPLAYNRVYFNTHYGIHFQYNHFQFSYNRTIQNDDLYLNELFGIGEFVLTYIF